MFSHKLCKDRLTNWAVFSICKDQFWQNTWHFWKLRLKIENIIIHFCNKPICRCYFLFWKTNTWIHYFSFFYILILILLKNCMVIYRKINKGKLSVWISFLASMIHFIITENNFVINKGVSDTLRIYLTRKLSGNYGDINVNVVSCGCAVCRLVGHEGASLVRLRRPVEGTSSWRTSTCSQSFWMLEHFQIRQNVRFHCLWKCRIVDVRWFWKKHLGNPWKLFEKYFM